MKYDQIVIGAGRDAVAHAITAAGQGHTVALVTPANHPTFDTAMLRQATDAVLRSGAVSMGALRAEVARLAQAQKAADQSELARSGVDVIAGEVQFVNADTIAVQSGIVVERLTAQTIVLACGTTAAEMARVDIDGNSVCTSENWLSLDKIPHSMVIIGAGQTGLDHAILLSRLGVEVTVVDEHSNVFDLCGGLMDQNLFEAQSLGVVFRLNDEVIGVESRSGDRIVAVRLASGRTLSAETVMVCIGRVGRTEGLNLESVGVGLDEQGRAWCDTNGRTWVPGIVAVGDVVGFRTSTAVAS
jgi:pyruvate/2-oxoglutarate dehydrogenase complex dihydrolipoamide dehydrogenase (E3) component